MKLRVYVFLTILFVGKTLFSQGINFFEGSFEEAKATALAEGKLIFVDAYAVWCGPCKRMSSSVFPLPEVGEAFNPYFVSMKIDMERGEGLTFRQKYPVTAFPTLFFMNEEGDILEAVVGAKSGPDLIKLAQKHSGNRKPSKNISEAYDKGDRSVDLVLEYIQALNRSGKSSLKITNEFLGQGPDFKDPKVLQIIYEGTTESDSRVFDYLIEHRKAIEKEIGAENVENRIMEAALRTVYKAAEYDYEDLYQQAKETVKKHVPKESKRFAAQADVSYAAILQSEKDFLVSAKNYAKIFEKESGKLLELSELGLSKFSKSNKVLNEALVWSKTAAEEENSVKAWFLHARIAEKANQIDLAKSSAQKALAIAVAQEQQSPMLERFIQNLELR